MEIDPRLLQIGRAQHTRTTPTRTRGSPCTSTTAARSSSGPTQKYDLILFALPDSLTLVAGASSLRLESYLFTQQAMEAPRSTSTPGGAFAMYNYYRENWLVDRLALTARDAFGHEPCVDIVGGGSQAVITAGSPTADQPCATEWAGAAADTPPPATDDRPFLYLYGTGIPALYLVTARPDPGRSAWSRVALAGGPGRATGGCGPTPTCSCSAPAFLLLETKSITGFALLFGTTWVVNAIVFAGVLLAVLAAVEVTRRFRTPPLQVMYVLLFAALVLNWLVPDGLAAGPAAGAARWSPRWSLAFLPIFVANVVFAKRFTDTADGTAAFGGQPARRDGRRLPGVPVADRRLPGAADRRRAALRRRAAPVAQGGPDQQSRVKMAAIATTFHARPASGHSFGHDLPPAGPAGAGWVV